MSIRQESQYSAEDREELQRMEAEEAEIAKWQAERDNARTGRRPAWDTIDCPICKNRTYITVANGPELISVDCSCRNKRIALKEAIDSGVKPDLSLEQWQTTLPWQKSVADKAREYIEKNPDKWFVMLGQSGAGKTMVCNMIVAALAAKGIKTKKVLWEDLLQELKNRAAENERYKSLMNVVKFEPVLFIDDFFKYAPSEWALSVAFQIIDFRARNYKKTLISSERFYPELSQIDEAIAGRIYENADPYLLQIKREEGNNYRTRSRV
ncbi:MAG: ATP-binding protein [Oscillospiraceae bacterium]|nr:ATP-binding protein [Oscillospiraceae bacterium]